MNVMVSSPWFPFVVRKADFATIHRMIGPKTSPFPPRPSTSLFQGVFQVDAPQRKALKPNMQHHKTAGTMQQTRELDVLVPLLAITIPQLAFDVSCWQLTRKKHVFFTPANRGKVRRSKANKAAGFEAYGVRASAPNAEIVTMDFHISTQTPQRENKLARAFFVHSNHQSLHHQEAHLNSLGTPKSKQNSIILSHLGYLTRPRGSKPRIGMKLTRPSSREVGISWCQLLSVVCVSRATLPPKKG